MTSSLFSATNRTNKFVLPAIVFIIATAYSILNSFTSPIDEGSHMGYINYLIMYHKLPIVNPQVWAESYITAHPPFYYTIMAVLSFWITNFKIRVLFVRILSGALLAWASYIATQIVEKNYKTSNRIHNAVLYSFVGLLFLSPGILVRSTTVSNEVMAIFLSTVLVYQFHRLWFKNQIQSKDILIVSTISALAVMSKISTTMFVPFLLVLLFLKLRKQEIKTIIRLAAIFAIPFLVLVLPWIIHNLLTYHALTGVRVQLDFCDPIVNPGRENYSFQYFFNNLGLFLYTFWFPLENPPSSFWSTIQIIMDGLCFTLIISSLTIFYNEGKSFFSKRMQLDAFPFLAIFPLIYIVAYLSFSYSALKLDQPLMTGRYILFASSSLIVVYAYFIKNFIKPEFFKFMLFINIAIILYWNIAYIINIYPYSNFMSWEAKTFLPSIPL